MLRIEFSVFSRQFSVGGDWRELAGIQGLRDWGIERDDEGEWGGNRGDAESAEVAEKAWVRVESGQRRMAS